MDKHCKIFIVDDEILFADALTTILNLEEDMEVIGSASNGLEALEQMSECLPDVVLTDIQMPLMNGIQLIKEVKERFPQLIVLILTTFNEEKYIVEGLAYGASGYLLKGENYKELAQSIRDTKEGRSVLPTEATEKLTHYLSKHNKK
ncbi:response regulator [Halalkalibacter okhensis]|uniref:response regulator n=1 Tax=Halalkalibacter okhensis TaxID=333138 RepID=UPI00068DADCC|nr:response regulator transcription factor [Halalkalibacter okhensis]